MAGEEFARKLDENDPLRHVREKSYYLTNNGLSQSRVWVKDEYHTYIRTHPENLQCCKVSRVLKQVRNS